MRVLQLIDSLDSGGAERVAVNMANALVERVDGSFLCTTRKEGTLKQHIAKGVNYLFLERTRTIDLKAILKLSSFIRVHNITHIHAHATSYFLATILKIFNANLKLVWHDHYGQSEFLDKRPKRLLKLCSIFFDHIFSVNSNLKDWAEAHLKSPSVSYLANYANLNPVINGVGATKLRGTKGKRIVCLANFRPQKDHLTLLKAFKLLHEDCPNWTLHLIGKDFNDVYSKSIYETIKLEHLEESVFVYTNCSTIYEVLEQCDIGVLSSKSEGLPLALLEYGLLKLAVVVTDTGFCAKVVKDKDNGLVVKSQSPQDLYKALLFLIKENKKRKVFSNKLYDTVIMSYSEKAIISQLVKKYQVL